MQKVKKFLPFIILMGVAAYVRIAFLGTKGLWIDEAYSVHLARLSLFDLVRKLSLECTPPLYYILLHVWTGLVGLSEFSVRLLSVVFSLGACGGLYSIARRFFSHSVARGVLLFCALSPLDIYYAQEARMYAVLVAEAIILLGCGLMLIQQARVSRYVWIGVVSVSMLYTHTVAVWYVAGIFFGLLFCLKTKRERLHLFFTGIGIGISFFPWFLVLVRQVAKQHVILDWFVPFWQAKTVFGHLWDSVCSFSFGPFPPYLGMHGAVTGSGVVGALVVGVGCFGAITTVRDRSVSRQYTFVVWILLFSVLAALAYSLFFQPVFIPGRTDVYVLPLFLLCLAVGVRRIPILAVRVGMYGVYVLLACITIVQLQHNQIKNDSRMYLAELREQVKSSDIVIATGMTFATADYYMTLWKTGAEVVSFPQNTADHPGFFNQEAAAKNPTQLVRDSEELVALCHRVVDAGGDIYVLTTGYELNAVLITQLNADFTHISSSSDDFKQSLLGIPVSIFHYQK